MIVIHMCPTCGHEIGAHHKATVTCPQPHRHKPRGQRTMQPQPRIPPPKATE